MSKRSLIQLTGAQKNALHALAANPVAAPSFASTEANPKLRVLTVHFDGTENDADHVVEDERATLVAESHRILSDRNDRLKSLYYQGVGTSKGPLGNKVDAMFGIGCRDNAEQAYADLVRIANQWQTEDSDVEVHVHVVGFSRGSATALHFMNMVDKFGVRGGKGRNMAPGNVKSSAVLFDTVSTGVTDLDLTLPNSNVATLHLTASGEERTFFKLTPLEDPRRRSELALARNVSMEGNPAGADGLVRYPRLQTLEIAGARHSDVGGSYMRGGIRELTAYLSREFQRSLGLPIAGVRPSAAAIQVMRANDSRWVRLSRDMESRQQAVRDEIKVDPVTWDGSYSEKVVCRVGADGAVVVSDNVRIVRSSPKDWEKGIGEADLGTAIRIEWDVQKHPQTGLPAVQTRMNGALSADLKFDRESDCLMLHGVAIQGAPTKTQLYDELRRHGRVSLEVGIERGLPVHDARQSTDFVAPMRPAAAGDQWPAEFGEALREINAGRVDLTTGQMHVYDCMQAAARELRAQFHELAGVRIVGPDKSQSGRFEVNCYRDDGRELRDDNDAADEREYLMTMRMRGFIEGLNCVVATVQEAVGQRPGIGRCTFGEVPQAPRAASTENPTLRPGLLASGGAAAATTAASGYAANEKSAPFTHRLRLVR